MLRVISHRVRLSLSGLFIGVPDKMLSSSLHFLSFKGSIIWACAVGPVLSSFVVYISFPKLDAYLRSLGLYVGGKLWFCFAQKFRKDFFVMMVYLVTVSVSVC